MRKGLTIGEFASLTHLSVRTLRRYHEAGLLEPASVDEFSGYRYYTVDQIPNAQVIHRLRELDVPLADVKAILATEEPQRRADLIAGHLQRLEDELDRTRAAVRSLRQLRVLELANTGIVDLEPLADLTALRRLDLRGTSVTDGSVLSRLPDCRIISLPAHRRRIAEGSP